MIVTARTEADWRVFREFATRNGFPQPDVLPSDVRVIGVMINKQLQAVVEFSQFCRRTCYLHVIGQLTPNVIRATFNYAFNKMGIVQLFGPISAANAQLLRLVSWLGFKELGRIKRGWDEHTDMIFVGMHVSQCRWLREKEHA